MKIKVGKNTKIIILIMLFMIIIIILSILTLSTTIKTNKIEELETEKYIGKYVSYKPEDGNYTASTDYGANLNNQIFTTDKNLKWRIWKIDNNVLYLISEKATSEGGYDNSGQLCLNGSLGYNNGVTLLDNICKECYSNSLLGATARNLKIEDIVEVASVSNSYAKHYGTTPYNYTSVNYPTIWNSYEKNSEDSINNRSVAYDLTTDTTENGDISPYYTEWHSGLMDTETAWESSIYYDMIMEPAYSTEYWLSSRFSFPNTQSGSFFGLQYVYSEGVTGADLFFSCYSDYINSQSTIFGDNLEMLNKDLDYFSKKSLRPIVSISLENINLVKSIETGIDYDISMQ